MEHIQAHTDLRHATADTSSREPAVGLSGARQQAQAQPPTAPPLPKGGDSPLRGVSLSSAQATLGIGRTLVTDYIMGANNTLAEIRVIDPTTYQVVAASPPETIAQIRQEMLAYQSLGKDSGARPDNGPTAGVTPPEAARSAE